MTATTFRRRQRVLVGNAMGGRVDAAVIVKPQKAPHADWYVVRFEDGSELSAHVSSIRAA